MHSRQRGAAHVSMIFFFLVLVLALGAVAFGYVQMTRATESEAKTAQLTADNEKLVQRDRVDTEYIEDVGAVFKVSGSYKGRSGTLDNIAGLTDPVALKQKLDTFAQQMGVTSFSSLETLFGAVGTQLDAKNARIKDLEEQVNKVNEEKRAKDAAFAEAGKTHADNERQLSDQITQTRDDLTKQIGTKDANLRTANQALNDKNTELADYKEQVAKDKKVQTAELNKIKAHSEALAGKIRLINPVEQPDGKVVSALNGVAAAWINLGRKDMLQSGTIFRIRNPRSDKVKAMATVTRVEQERAEITLSGVVDPLNDAVREGDLLYNDFYTPGLTRNIYLMGRFSYPYNKGEVEKLLTSLGNKIHSKLDPSVDLVILGFDPTTDDGTTPITDSAEYKEAVNLGCEFAPLNKVRDLIKL